jgi:hypothetical protein
MAPGLGVDFLDKDLHTYLDIPRDVFYNYEDASAMGLLMKLFSPKGTSTWVILPLSALLYGFVQLFSKKLTSLVTGRENS